MAFNYPGNPLATQAPSPAPGPGVIPIIVIPGGTDASTIESIMQQMKVSADFHAYWSTILNAGLPSLSSTQAQTRYQATDTTARSIVDYLGFRTGPVIETVDSTMGIKGFSGVQSAAFLGGVAGWSVTSTTNSSGVRQGGLANAGCFPGGVYELSLTSARTSSDSILFGTPLFYNTYSGTGLFGSADPRIADYVVTPIEWAFALGDSGSNSANADWFMGLGTDLATIPFTSPSTYITAALRYAPTANGDTTINLITSDGTTQHTVNTGLTPTSQTRYRVRLEIHRAHSALGSAVVRCYIATTSGANTQVASTLFTSTVNLPINATLPVDLLWKVYLKSTGAPSTAARIDLAYWKMFAQSHGRSRRARCHAGETGRCLRAGDGSSHPEVTRCP
jgi:hypothetical protein